jgi:hypothetical protein
MRRDGERRRDGPETLQGHEILQETTRLLSQMSFWANRGAYAEGRGVAISVDPRWDEDHETMQVLLTCHAFGERRVDWQALPVFARSAETRQVSGMTRLDARGQGVMARLQPDDYRLFVPERYGRSEAPLAFGSVSVQGNLAAATEVRPDAFEPYLYDSWDGSVRATVYQTVEGLTVVAFETWEAELAGAVVCFAFLGMAGDILHSASVELVGVEEEPGLLEARWEAEATFGALCSFEFGVLPRDL